MHHGPFLPTLALAAGIATASTCGLAWWWGAIPICVALAVYLVLLKVPKDPVASFRLGKWHAVWVASLFFGIGLSDEALSRPQTMEEAFGGVKPEYIECEVTGILTRTYGESIDAKIAGTNGAKARIRTGVSEVSPGDIIIIPTQFLTETATDTTTIGKKLAPALKAAGIMYAGRTVPGKIRVIGRSQSPAYFFTEIRNDIESTIERSHLRKSTADFLKAILLGDKTGLDEETRLTFAQGGMAHMLALSGLHIGILAGFIMMLMWPIKLLGKYKWGYGAALVILWLYVAVTGMAYSSVRACIMTTFAFIGIMAERKNFAGNALCSACLLILIADPTALFDVGFQLSVVCVGALIAYASRLNPIGHRQHPLLFAACGAAITTMVATAASWALTSYYFSQIPLMFLPTNLLLLPLLPVYLSLAVVFVGLLYLDVEAGWMCRILDGGYEALVSGVEWLSGGPEYVVDYQVPLWGATLWMACLAAGAYILNRKETK